MPRFTLRHRRALRCALPILLAVGLTACEPTADNPTQSGGNPAVSQPNVAQAPAGGGEPVAQSEVSSSQTSKLAAPQASSTDAASADGELHRVAGITDGDTIKVWIGDRKETVRLLGVDAPESKKPNTAVACYAQQASSKMQSLVQSKQVRLEADPTQADRDRYGRLVRYVLLADGRDVSHELISEGFGREYTYAAAYAKQTTFRSAQAQAQTARRGLWGSCTYAAAFNPPTTTPTTTPIATRPAAPTTPATKPAPAKPNPPTKPIPPTSKPSAPAPVAGQCVIKGNISTSGEKIYHVPGQQYYNATKITLSKGERWFCSEQDAQNAGWRRAKV